MGEGDSEQSLNEWRARLEQLDAELAERERQALVQDERDAAEHHTIAKLRDEVAAEWDALAGRYDAWARRRDVASLRGDDAASGRDLVARSITKDLDPAFLHRSLSAKDRDYSAADRADSGEDRRRGREARERAGAERERAAEARDTAVDRVDSREQELARLRREVHASSELGQAIGVVMIRHNLSSDDAFALLCRRSRDLNIDVLDFAASLLAEAQPERS